MIKKINKLKTVFNITLFIIEKILKTVPSRLLEVNGK